MAYIEGGLWGCIVVIAAFFIQVVAFGTSMCIGVYNVVFLEYFKSNATAVSLVGSINLGLFLGSGPLASMLMTKWSCRQIALIGAVLSNIGVITMPFAPNLPFMYVFYGVISGLGYGLLYVPSHVLSGLYFYKQRSLATGLATAGSGMGSSVFPVLFHYLIEHYGWRGSFYIVAGVNLHSFVFAALLRPVPDDLRKRLERKEFADIQIQSTEFKPETAFMSEDIKSVDFCTEKEFIKDKTEEKDKETDDVALMPMLKDIDENEMKQSYIDEPCLNKNRIHIDSKGPRTVSIHSDGQTFSRDKTNNTLSEKIKNHFRAVFTFDFLMYCLSNVFWNAGIGILLIFLPKYIESVGLNRQNASIAFTAMGIGACFGCVSGGVLGNIKFFNRIILYIVGNFLLALTAVLMVIEYVHNFTGLFLLSMANGFQFGMILGLLVVVTSDLLGTEALGDGYGYLMFSNGVGIFAGPPIAGALIDATSDLGTGLLVSGLITAFGGLSMCAVPIRRKIAGTSRTTKNIIIEIE